MDTAGMVTVLDNGQVKALRNDATGETLVAGEDFKSVIPCEIFGYWQRYGEDGSAENLTDKIFPVTQFKPGQTVKIVFGRTGVLANFIK